MNRRRFVLVDDHAMVRAGVRSLLETMPTCEVVGETGDGLVALDLVTSVAPDILLLDLSLPGLSGLEVLARLGALEQAPRVVVLSMHSGPEYVARALNAGAAAYLLKDSAFDELAQAIDTVMVGRRYLSQALEESVIERFQGEFREGKGELDVLTPRQREILQLISEGQGTRRIAERLGLSVKTVETHRAQLMDRLGIFDIPGLVKFALRNGLTGSGS